MIVYPAGYPAAEAAAGRPIMHPRILFRNYANGVSPANIVASGETPSGPADALTRPDSYEFWIPPGLPATYEINIGGPRSVSAIGLAAHTLGSTGITATVETAAAAEALAVFSAEHSPSTDAPILWLDSPRDIDRVLLTFEGAGDAPRMASLFIGPTLTMEKPMQIGFRPRSRKVVRETQTSRGGDYLGQHKRRIGQVLHPAFRFLSEVWYDANFDPFVLATEDYPYFFAPRPDVMLNDVYYAWHEDDIEPIFHTTRHLSVEWEMFALRNE